MDPRVFVLALSTFSFGSSAFIFAGVLEPMAADLGVATGTVGQLQTVYVLTAALAGPPLAMMLGRRERKSILLLALATSIVFSLLCSFAANFSQLLGLRAVLGGVAALAGPGASTMAASLVPPEKRGSAMATVTGGMTIAFLLGIPMGSVVGSAFGWRATFLLSAFLALVAFTGVALFTPRVTPPAPIKGGKLAIATALPLWTAAFLAFGANMTISTYLAPIIRLQTGVTGAGVGAFQLVIGVGSFLGLWLGGRSADRGKGALLVGLAFLTLACGAGLHTLELVGGAPAGLATNAMVCLAILVTATSLFAIMPVLQSRLVEALPTAAVLALAINGSAVSLGQALGGANGGLMLTQFGGPAITISAMALAIAGAVFWFLTAGRARPG
ncbi:MAG: MFS transporter [Phenylobacterium sp.]|uniref:MFS transporter n=1 Tax=Phenylobacterium sp. TaxID=1871053 RepID=UPI0027335287|nr:MFS transporter [Phenylobacterium sp.]MDP3748992.1 MFS transporter [Phenylobacterium sp.]